LIVISSLVGRNDFLHLGLFRNFRLAASLSSVVCLHDVPGWQHSVETTE